MRNFTRVSLAVIMMVTIASTQLFGQISPGQIPLNPKVIPQFVDPLPHFAGNRVDASGGSLTIKYVPHEQVAVSTGTSLATGIVGPTPGAGQAKFWTYSISNGGEFTPPFWPGFTIEARVGLPVNITYLNELYGETYASVNLIADQTLHWAAPPQGVMGSFDPYTGPIPVVPHLHGGEVASESDGGPDAWFTPDYDAVGPSWGNGGTDQYYYYPNSQEAATLWYHDHSLGVTRLNVYAGLAGFYFLKSNAEEDLHLPGWPGDDKVHEVQPAGIVGQPVHDEPYLPEIEIVFQDRMFDISGALYYPNLPPNPDDHPYWTPEFVGDVITVNGKTWPYLSVAPRKYRFRLLNGSNARFYEIYLVDMVTKILGPSIVQIGTDGGLLDTPVTINGKLLLGPGERADVIIDFSTSAPGQVWTLRNTGNTPFPKGEPPNGATVGRLMQFIVNGQMVSASNPANPGVDNSVIPTSLRPAPMVRLTNFDGSTNVTPSVTRQLTLNEVMGLGGPLEVLVNNTKWDGNGPAPGLGITETPTEGTTELWQIINLTADAHPIHMHLVQMQLVSRQKFNVNTYTKAYNDAFGGTFLGALGPPLPYGTPNTDGAVGGNPAISRYFQGPVKPANLNEQGWKDTFVMYPGEVTTFAVRYAPTDLPLATPMEELLYPFDPSIGPGYVWHCHILDHEDNEMMRPYEVLPNPVRGATTTLTLKSAKAAEDLSAAADVVEPTESTTLLEQNYPNPFRDETEIHFVLPESQNAQLVLYGQSGELIKVLIDALAPAGTNIVKLDATGLSAGTYFYQLITNGFSDIKKMIVID